MARNITILLFIMAVLLTACGSSDRELSEFDETSDLPGAGDINEAAGRAAANAQTEEDKPEETPYSDSDSSTSKVTPEQPTTEQQPTEPPTNTPEEPSSEATTSSETTASSETTTSSETTNRRVEVGEIGRFPQLLPFDGIRPVYDPQFATAEEAPLDDMELIIGIAIDGEAKAYPISVLNFREMVNDELAGIPTLVTW